MTSRAPRRDLLVATAGAFCFALTIVFNRVVARDGLAPTAALSIRFAVAAGTLVVVQLVRRRSLLPPRGERSRVAAVGLVLYSVEAVLFYAALERGTAAAVALLFYVYPVVVTLMETALGWLRPDRGFLLALALGVVGAGAVAIGGGDVAITPAGVALVMGSVLLASTYVVLSDRLVQRTDPVTVAAWFTGTGALGLGVVGALTGALEVPSGDALLALVANGVATAAAFALFFSVVGRLGPSRTSVVMALEAVFSVVLAAVFLDEAVQALVAVGGLLVISGAVLAARRHPPRVEAVETGTPP